uniref:Uncharacterized protein n=1 Tax=Psilocybe cubensis TaxID=181762 RepID=A0A8H8CFU7_PSICU
MKDFGIKRAAGHFGKMAYIVGKKGTEILNQLVHAVLNSNPHHNAVLFQSLNQCWSAEEDNDILKSTKPWGYWWDPGHKAHIIKGGPSESAAQAHSAAPAAAQHSERPTAGVFHPNQPSADASYTILSISSALKHQKSSGSSKKIAPQAPASKAKDSFPSGPQDSKQPFGSHSAAPPVANTWDHMSPIAISDHRPPYCPKCGQPIFTCVMRSLANLRLNLADMRKTADEAVAHFSDLVGRYLIIENIAYEYGRPPFEHNFLFPDEYKLQHPVHPKPDGWNVCLSEMQYNALSQMNDASFCINGIFYSFVALKELSFHPPWLYSTPLSRVVNVQTAPETAAKTLDPNVIPVKPFAVLASSSSANEVFVLDPRASLNNYRENNDDCASSSSSGTSVPADYLEQLAEQIEDEEDFEEFSDVIEDSEVSNDETQSHNDWSYEDEDQDGGYNLNNNFNTLH